jgi:hypothetical protein
MTDRDLVRGFEAATLDDLPHEAHVRLAWRYLMDEPLLTAIARFRDGLRRYAAAKGRPERYHETITIALLLLIAERRRDDDSWQDFAARNPELLRWPSPLLRRWYPPELLESPRAREVFVVPQSPK